MIRTDILDAKDKILQWIKEGQSKAFISRELDCKQETLNKYLKQMGIEYSGNQSGRGLKKKEPKTTLAEYLQTSIDLQSNKIRKKILEEGIKPYKCQCCGNTQWLGNPIPLELHHIDGDKNHNELSNFMLLCPNCHAFTDSYRGKNIHKK